MKEYRCYACPKYIVYSITTVSLIALLGGLFIFSSTNSLLEKIIYFLDTILFFSLFFYCVARGAYVKTYISETGIRNKFLTISWDEIQSYRLCEINQKYTWPKIKYPMIVCIGEVDTNNFAFFSPKKAVSFSLTKKNLKAIEELCHNKNETIKELLSWNEIPTENW